MSASADTLTILRSAGPPLAKLIHADGRVTTSDAALYFDMHAKSITDMEELETTLRVLIRLSTCAVVRGAIADPDRTIKVRRLIHPRSRTGDPPTLCDVPRSWLALDVEGIELPHGVAATDLVSCYRAALQTLPSAFAAASCIVQASGGHGLKPDIRLRLWFWCNRPVTGNELRQWLQGTPCDMAVFNAAQLIFTAAPIFLEGTPDHLPERIVRVVGKPTVSVPPPEAFVFRGGRQARQPAKLPNGGGGWPPANRCPPNVNAVVELLNRMPNPIDVDRETYTRVMLATAGCVAALLEAGTLGDDGEEQIAEAAIGWAQRWPNCTTDEREKWDCDWRTQGSESAGWQWLQREAAKLTAGPAAQIAGSALPSLTNTVGSIADDQPLLDRAAPQGNAQEMIRRQYVEDDCRTLLHQGGVFFHWTGTHYSIIAAEEMRAAAYAFLGKAMHSAKNGVESFKPTSKHVNDMIDALAAETQLRATARAPAWVDDTPDQPPAREILSCANGLMHLPTRRLLAHTPRFFGTTAIDFAFDPAAPEPIEWLTFLRTIWPHDPQSIETLQEMFGLLLTGDTR
jgi:hypothetical protein